MEKKSLQSWGITLLRILVGVVFLMHGGQKLFVWHFQGVAGFLGQIGVPVPYLSAIVLTLVEFVGGAALVLGAFTRVSALLLAVDMLVAVLLVHLKNGFFLPTGYEFALTMLVASVSLFLTGAGAASVDGLIHKEA